LILLVVVLAVINATPSSAQQDNVTSGVATVYNNWNNIVHTFQTTETSQVMQTINQTGYQSFLSSVSVQHMRKIPQTYFETFVNHLMSDIQVPEDRRSELIASLLNVQNAQSNEWVSFDMMFNNGMTNSTLCKCVSILVRRNVEQSAYDVMMADVQASFALAPNVLVVRKSVSVNGGLFTDSTDEIVDVPKTVSQDDVTGMLNFAKVVAGKSFGDLLHLQLPMPSVPSATIFNVFASLAMGPSPLDPITSGISAITNSWTQIVNAFKSSSESTLQQVLVGRGFKTFSESAQMTRGVGIPDTYFDTFIGHQLQGFTVPAQYQQQLANYIQDIHYIDEEEWSGLDMQFSIDAGGSCKYAAVMSRLRADGKHDWMSCNLQATFSLAPDVYVIRKSSSILGGIFSKTEDTFKIVPRGLTMDDINAIFAYLKMVAYKQFADIFGINLQLPPGAGQ